MCDGLWRGECFHIRGGNVITTIRKEFRLDQDKPKREEGKNDRNREREIERGKNDIGEK